MSAPYPPAPRLDIVDDLHGRKVADPYRWPEDPSSATTMAWTEAEDDLARQWLDGRPGRDRMRRRLRELLPGIVSAPAVRGDRLFLLRRLPEQEHATLVTLEGDEPPDGGRVLIDPSALSPDATVTLDAWRPPKEGDRLAYRPSRGAEGGGGLWGMAVAPGATAGGPINRCR